MEADESPPPMDTTKMKPPYVLFVVLTSMFFAVPAQAHTPGISLVDLDVDGDLLTVTATFAQPEIAGLTETPADLDALIGGGNPAAASAALSVLADKLITVRSDTGPLKLDGLAVTRVEGDGLAFRMHGRLRGARSLRVDSATIGSLSLGHRQFVSMRVDGQPAQSGILSVQTPMVDFDLDSSLWMNSFLTCVGEGVHHILIGFDHLLFLAVLLLPAVLVRQRKRWYPIVSIREILVGIGGIVSAFTVAHSITLSAAVLGWMNPPSPWVEASIAATVIIAALNNLYPLFRAKAWRIAFLLGLVHGFGFAGALAELGLDGISQAVALAGFNLGVEAGQLVVVLTILPLVFLLRTWKLYQPVLLRLGSVGAAVVAAVWLFERVFPMPAVAIG